jgi:hypothetical protein
LSSSRRCLFWRSFLDPALLIGFWGNIITAIILPI